MRLAHHHRLSVDDRAVFFRESLVLFVHSLFPPFIFSASPAAGPQAMHFDFPSFLKPLLYE